MKKTFSEFKTFISKGNALDLAVGIVIGTAFNQIIKSLVNDIIMPLLSLIVKGDIKNLYVVLRGSATFDTNLGQLILSEDAILLRYGNFIGAIIDFMIISLAIFFALKVMMMIRRKWDSLSTLVQEKILNEESNEVKS